MIKVIFGLNRGGYLSYEVLQRFKLPTCCDEKYAESAPRRVALGFGSLTVLTRLHLSSFPVYPDLQNIEFVLRGEDITGLMRRLGTESESYMRVVFPHTHPHVEEADNHAYTVLCLQVTRVAPRDSSTTHALLKVIFGLNREGYLVYEILLRRGH